MTEVDVLIIGGGISGLTLAQRLARGGASVELWEQDARLGGKIHSRRQDGYLTERAASTLLNFRPEVNRFMTELGLDAHKLPRASTANRYILSDGRLRALPMRLGPLLASPLWSLRGKLRMLLEPLVPKGGHPDETVSAFITRRLGREALEKGMGPYVAGPLASDPALANAWSVLPRLVALEQRYGSLAMGIFVHRVLRRRTATATEAFSFQGGMTTLVESLAHGAGLRCRPGHRATAVARTAHGWQAYADTETGECSVHARHLVLSVPAEQAAALLVPVNGELAALLRGIEYTPLAVVHTGFDATAVAHRLDGSGFLCPADAGIAPTGCQWMSSLFPGCAPPGKVLLSSYLGGACNREVTDWDDDRKIAATLQALRPLLGLRGEPEMVHIDHHARALPLYHGAYRRQMQALEQQLSHWPGLHLEANYRGGISVRDRIVRALHASERILHALDAPAPVTYSFANLSLGSQTV